MNSDNVKGTLQEFGGRVEEAAGTLINDENLKNAGKEDQLRGKVRDAWGNVKQAGMDLVDQARVAKADAELKSTELRNFEREHEVTVIKPATELKEEPKD